MALWLQHACGAQSQLKGWAHVIVRVLCWRCGCLRQFSCSTPKMHFTGVFRAAAVEICSRTVIIIAGGLIMSPLLTARCCAQMPQNHHRCTSHQSWTKRRFQPPTRLTRTITSRHSHINHTHTQTQTTGPPAVNDLSSNSDRRFGLWAAADCCGCCYGGKPCDFGRSSCCGTRLLVSPGCTATTCEVSVNVCRWRFCFSGIIGICGSQQHRTLLQWWHAKYSSESDLKVYLKL